MKDLKQLIAENKKEVEAKYQMSGLSDGLYGDYASDVTEAVIKSLLLALRERTIEIGRDAEKSHFDRFECTKGFHRINTLITEAINSLEE